MCHALSGAPRWVALLLAVLMAISACFMHPFWIYAFSTKTYRMEVRICHLVRGHGVRVGVGRACVRWRSAQAQRLNVRTCFTQGVAHMEGFEVDAFTMGDHQRYFFFQARRPCLPTDCLDALSTVRQKSGVVHGRRQTMSTVGALLLLVVHGPGKLSLDEQQGRLVLVTTHDA